MLDLILSTNIDQIVIISPVWNTMIEDIIQVYESNF